MFPFYVGEAYPWVFVLWLLPRLGGVASGVIVKPGDPVQECLWRLVVVAGGGGAGCWELKMFHKQVGGLLVEDLDVC